ncbi:RHS repeat-associated core domain-containing protein, partial [Weeksella sp. HMSC059D05]|uniref:RHS repeat-associated core domain-containing protein n=1 Tax=Weeksella sp. HMSC059D05 TaxID=1715139 RepID=UPI000A960D9A
TGSATYNYKFNGQEFQDELGLNWYKYRYRNYDPTFARFFSVDPITEDYYNISTYQFAHNNPAWKIEIEGLEGQETSGEDKQTTLGKVWSAVESGMEWVNENINPLTPIVELATGKSYSSDFTEDKSRLESGAEVVMGVVPAGKAVGTTGKVLTKGANKTKVSKSGRSANKRKPNQEAQGDHSTFNERGNTTYKKNEKNPSGFDEVKRTDIKGKSHTNKDGTKVDTPHVHEKGTKDVRPAVKGKDY